MSGLFLVGAPRSGTTLLQSILCSHSQLYSTPETSFFCDIIPRLGVEYRDPDHPISEQDIATIKQSFQQLTGMQVRLDGLSPGAGIKAAFEALLSEFNHDNKPKWIEKTTNHARSMLVIRKFYPDAKFIHIIRDPVDSIGSMTSLRPTSVSDTRVPYVSSFYGFANLWLECVRSALCYPHQDSVLHLYYEDLVKNPNDVILKVFDFLGIPFEAPVTENFHKSAENLFSAESCPWQNSNLTPGFHTDKIHKWRKKLSPAKVWLIQYYTADLARSFGYYEKVETCSNISATTNLLADQLKRIIATSRIEVLFRNTVSSLTR